MSVRSARYNRLSLRSPKGTSAIPKERDAWAFLDAAGITSSRQQEAIIQLVRDLKGYGLWSKMKAIYPFVGGTATTHKWNLKDPRDSDAAFRLTFNGGWTHSSNGALPNGTTGYAETYFTPSTNWSNTTGHISTYLRTNNTTQAIDIGAWVTAQGFTYIYTYYTLSGTPGRDYRLNDTSGQNARISSITRTDGFYLASRTSTSLETGYRNGAVEITNTTSGTAIRTSISITIGALKGFANPAGLYSNRETAFATIGDGLTDTDATNLYNAVDRYQKFLGRAV